MHGRRPGFTLVELVASMGIMTLLMGAMTSAIVIATHAIPNNTDPEQQNRKAMEVVEQIASELFYATTVTEATARSVTFTVADRGHGASGPEEIRYEWSGTPGDPLTRQYNNGTVCTVCEGVEQLTFTFERRCVELSGLPRVMLAVVDPAALSAQESARKSLLETYGFPVQTVSENSTTDAWDAAMSSSDILYIVDELNSLKMNFLIPRTTIGIANEDTDLFAEIGVAMNGSFDNGTDLTILDNTHDITSVFSTGALQVFSVGANFAITMSALSAGTQGLGSTRGGYDSLLVIDVGGEMNGGGTANARRVCLPWAGLRDFDFSNVNSDGRTIMRRAIVWASAPVVYSGARIALQPLANSASVVETQTQFFTKPRANGS